MEPNVPGLEPGEREMTMASRLASRKVMTLTEAAASRVKEIMADKAAVGLRVGVRNGGCAGMSYTMELADSIAPLDEVIEDKGVKVLIDPKAVLFLLGAEMDFKADRLGSSFSFRNPNETSACGCGESVAITPAAPEALETA
jgi:iron-sulfur cluster assembly protein